jgi:hypothetical protein
VIELECSTTIEIAADLRMRDVGAVVKPAGIRIKMWTVFALRTRRSRHYHEVIS